MGSSCSSATACPAECDAPPHFSPRSAALAWPAGEERKDASNAGVGDGQGERRADGERRRLEARGRPPEVLAPPFIEKVSPSAAFIA